MFINSMGRHHHLNLVGGISGDMFIAAVLDLYPNLEKPTINLLTELNLNEAFKVSLSEYNDSCLRGKRLNVVSSTHHHHAASYVKLNQLLSELPLGASHRSISCQILEQIAKAESVVHGVSLQEVHLHEAGSPDSIADMICAGFLIDKLQDSSWSSDPLPIGKGRIKTEHGELALPAPAVTHLLKGLPVFDDGRLGERVTPTGAAIIQVLDPAFNSDLPVMQLLGSGTGFGSSKFEGISNVLRIVAFEQHITDFRLQKIAQLELEIDDQTPEDLAVGLDRLRKVDGVLDVLQIPAIGKKGRMTVQVQVLGQLQRTQEIAAACLLETSTLGVRYRTVSRLAVDRTEVLHREDSKQVPVKIASRKDGQVSSKVESDYLAKAGNYQERKTIKQKIELSVENSANQRNIDDAKQ